MMISPRWRKMFRDLWSSKTSSALVILSIAVGVFAIGMIAGTHAIMSEGMDESFRAANQANAMIFTIEPFDEQLIESIRNMDEVQDVVGRYVLQVRSQVSAPKLAKNEWRTVRLFALPDYNHIPINKVTPEVGPWPPPKREVLIERDALDYLGVNIGDHLLIETASGKMRELRVAGRVHEMVLYPAGLAGRGYGYITFETLEWLGIPYSFNEVVLIPNKRFDKAYSQHTINLVQDRLEEHNLSIRQIIIPEMPDRHYAQNIVDAILMVLAILGVLILFLSGFLVINTISALLIRQTRQIGIMKTIGARPHQLIPMYSSMALLFGLLATVMAMPFSQFAAYALSGFLLGAINLSIPDFDIPLYVYLIQLLIGLVVPTLAALQPIISGTRLTVREAIYDSESGKPGAKLVDKLLKSMPTAILMRASRPLLLSLRNTFRQTRRMVLTLGTLILGSAMLMAVLSVRASTARTFDEAAQYWQYDVEVTLERPYRLERIEKTALQVPGVVQAEGWGSASVRRVRADESESTNILLLAPPVDSQLLEPIVVRGRWLHPDDQNAIVIDLDVLQHEPDINIGDDIKLKIEGREVSLQVVGIVKGQYRGVPVVYANYSYFAREMVREIGRASRLVVVAKGHDPAFQSQVAGEVEKQFKDASLKIRVTETMSEIRSRVERQFNIVIALLVIMATLISAVGGLGLTGTMSLNVLERTREIGIMRAIGASNRAVRRIIIFEGILIGLLSWAGGVILAYPLSKFLSDAVGIALTQSPLSYTFSLNGVFLCLIVMLLLSAFATFLPAWNASQLTVKETLTHD